MSNEISRREWTKLSLTGLAGLMIPSYLVSCKTASSTGNKNSNGSIEGVVIGAHTYSFRDMSLNEALKAMNDIGIKSCELFSQHLEPADFVRKPNPTQEEWRKQKEALKVWRTHVTMDEVKAIRNKIEKAGVHLQGYSDIFPPKDTDEAFEQVFKIAQALGVETISTSATVSLMKRIDGFAKKYKIKVAMHNHANINDPDQFATPDSFMRGMEGNSDFIMINLDIGHFTAANFDAVDFMKKHHARIDSIHLKDRKKNQGANLPFGEGDTPIVEVLRLIRDNKWNIPANIEYEYKGSDTVAEVRRCFEYCRRALS